MSDKEDIEIKNKDNLKENKKTVRGLTLMRESPFSLFNEVDRFIDDFFNDSWWPFNHRYQPFNLLIRDNQPIFRTPLVNIDETETQYNITAEIPGINKGDIELTIQDGKLEIRGKTKEDKKEESDGKVVRREYHSSKYFRSFNLPDFVDEDSIEANLEKGILKILIPKVSPPEPQRKKIAIE